MKYLLTASLGLFAFSAMAADFASMKQEKLNYMDQKIQRMQENRTCVQNATTEAALNSCKESMKSAMKDMKHDHDSMDVKKGKRQAEQEKPTGTSEASEYDPDDAE